MPRKRQTSKVLARNKGQAMEEPKVETNGVALISNNNQHHNNNTNNGNSNSTSATINNEITHENNESKVIDSKLMAASFASQVEELVKSTVTTPVNEVTQVATPVITAQTLVHTQLNSQIQANSFMPSSIAANQVPVSFKNAVPNINNNNTTNNYNNNLVINEQHLPANVNHQHQPQHHNVLNAPLSIPSVVPLIEPSQPEIAQVESLPAAQNANTNSVTNSKESTIAAPVTSASLPPVTAANKKSVNESESPANKKIEANNANVNASSADLAQTILSSRNSKNDVEATTDQSQTNRGTSQIQAPLVQTSVIPSALQATTQNSSTSLPTQASLPSSNLSTPSLTVSQSQPPSHSIQSPIKANNSQHTSSSQQQQSTSPSTLFNQKLAKNPDLLAFAHKRSPSSPVPPLPLSGVSSGATASSLVRATKSLPINEQQSKGASSVPALGSGEQAEGDNASQSHAVADGGAMPVIEKRSKREPKKKKQQQEDASPTRKSKKRGLSKNESANKGDEDEDKAERMSKRVRLPYKPFQSPEPLPNMPLIYRTTFTAPRDARDQSKPEDKVVMFQKNEYLAVRNESAGFFICRAVQNVYKYSRKFRIQWFNNDKNVAIYVPDFYDVTDFECVLTNLRVIKLKEGQIKIPDDERQRTMNILERAINVEKGINVRPDPSQVVTDGVDVSIVGKKEEKELMERMSPKRVNSTKATTQVANETQPISASQSRIKSVKEEEPIPSTSTGITEKKSKKPLIKKTKLKTTKTAPKTSKTVKTKKLNSNSTQKGDKLQAIIAMKSKRLAERKQKKREIDEKEKSKPKVKPMRVTRTSRQSARVVTTPSSTPTKTPATSPTKSLTSPTTPSSTTTSPTSISGSSTSATTPSPKRGTKDGKEISPINTSQHGGLILPKDKKAGIVDVVKECKSFQLIPRLVEKGIDVNETDPQTGNTILHYVCKKPDQHAALEAVRSLVSKGALVNARNKQGKTPLRIAVFSHRNEKDGKTVSRDVNFDLEDFLIKSGANFSGLTGATVGKKSK